MAKYHGRKTELTRRKKRKANIGSKPRNPKMADKEVRKVKRVRGGRKKMSVLTAQFANISVGGKTQKVRIKMVGDNSANKDFRRENVLSLGGIIETELGKAKITSRPSQDGVVNAVLLK